MKNIFSVITLKTMRQNRTRTIVTIIGVILSTAMITAVTSFGLSIVGFLHDYEIEQNGNWHVLATNVSKENAAELIADERVEAGARIDEPGYIKWEKVKESGNDWGYLCLGSLSAEALEMYPVTLSAGRMPENDDEIIIPNYLAVNEPEGEETKVGDVVEAEVGDLSIDGGRINRSMYVEDEKAGTETLENAQKKTFTVVGIYDYTLTYISTMSILHQNGASAFAVYCGPSAEPAAYAEVFVRMKEPRQVYDFAEEKAGLADGFYFHEELLRWEGVADNDNYSKVLLGLIAIVTALIMAAAISLIYNAFSISLRERTKQFGLLSSVGATKKQLRWSLLLEALYVSVIGIPLGVLSGLAGIGVTLRYIGHGLTGALYGVERQMELKVSLPVLIVTVLLALLTVLISAWVPSLRIRRISPMEAIRSNRDIRVSPKEAFRFRQDSKVFMQQVSSKRFPVKLFGVSGMIADKNYRRDRKKYRSTIFSITLSIVLFVSAMSISDVLRKTGSFVLEAPESELLYSVYEYPEGETPESIRTFLEKQEGVQQVIYYRSGQRLLGFTQETLMEQENIKNDSTPVQGDAVGALYGCLIVLPDKTFDAALRAQGLDPADYYGQETVCAAVYDTCRSYNAETQRYERRQLFSDFPVTCGMGFAETVAKEGSEGGEEALTLRGQSPLTLQARLTELPEGVVNTYERIPHVLVAESEAQRWELTKKEDGYISDYFSIMCSDYQTLYETLEKDLRGREMLEPGRQYLNNLAGQYEQDRSFLMAINVLTFGFVTLLTLVAAANAFNTISTNLLLRRREFAMLRSMGMSGRGLRRMMCFESLIYSLHSLIPGVVLATGISFLVNLVLRIGADAVFRVPWRAIGIAAVGVFLIVSGTIAVTMRTIRKVNICEELKMNE